MNTIKTEETLMMNNLKNFYECCSCGDKTLNRYGKTKKIEIFNEYIDYFFSFVGYYEKNLKHGVEEYNKISKDKEFLASLYQIQKTNRLYKEEIESKELLCSIGLSM